MGSLSGKVAIVTGAGRGIGRGIALRYAAEGARVVVASRTPSTVESVVQEVRDAGGIALGVTVDVGHQDQIKGMVQQTMEAFGAIDILVNNAQGFGSETKPAPSPVLTPLEEFDNDQWEYTFRTGASATLWGMQAAFPHMKERGGKIINFGSHWGQIGMAGAAAYNATKEAIRGLSRTAAREWGRYGITVNVINPALQTDAMKSFQDAFPEVAEEERLKLPLQRWGDPYRDGGGVALFLASADSDYLTGMTFQLDGGMNMQP